MPSWFKPRCPLETGEKAWVEYRMRWLADRFGIERIERSPFLSPTDLEFDDWGGSREEGEWLFERICEPMEVDPGNVRLIVTDDVQFRDVVGQDGTAGDRSIIRIRHSQLSDPMALAATFAHELAGEVLLRGGYLTGDEPDLEWIADLLPAVVGLGLFAANTTVRFDSTRAGRWVPWSTTRQGFLPARIFGYALALMTLFRYEDESHWIKYLRADAAKVYRGGLAFLEAGGDSLFDPDSYASSRPPRLPADILHDLEQGTPTFRLAAMWDAVVADQKSTAAVVRLVNDSDAGVAIEAIRWLGSSAYPLAAEQEDELIRLLDSPSDSVRLAAAVAVGRRKIRPSETLDALRHLTSVEDRNVAAAAVWAIGQFGRVAAAPASSLIRALEQANIDGDATVAEAASRALCDVVESPLEVLRDYYADHDPELHRMAREAIRAVSPPSSGDVSAFPA